MVVVRSQLNFYMFFFKKRTTCQLFFWKLPAKIICFTHLSTFDWQLLKLPVICVTAKVPYLQSIILLLHSLHYSEHFTVHQPNITRPLHFQFIKFHSSFIQIGSFAFSSCPYATWIYYNMCIMRVIDALSNGLSN